MRQIELLAPAGSYEAAMAALAAGADAVYAGGSRFGARAYADNFTEDQLLAAIEQAHLRGKRLYLTVNTLFKDSELMELYDYLLPFYRCGLDAVIVQDIGVLTFIREQFPGLPVHASTQMTIKGAPGAAKMKELGAARIVTARELSVAEVAAIHAAVDIEIESFIHGACCYSYSGQCLFSSMLGGRSGNRGRCAGPCRLPYDTLENGHTINKPEERYVLSLKDMCTIEILPKLIEAGVCSMKIEGRMKKPEYTAGVTAIYRKYLDICLETPQKPYAVEPADLKRLTALYTRGGLSTGYYENPPGRRLLTMTKPGYASDGEGLMDAREQYVGHLPALPVTGRARFAAGEPAKLVVSCQGQTAEAEGFIVEPSRRQAAAEADVRRLLCQTGGTPFAFELLDISLAEGMFLPVGAVKELRRQALAMLLAKLRTPFERQTPARLPVMKEPSDRYGGERPVLQVSVESEPALRAALTAEAVKAVYVSYVMTELGGGRPGDLKALAADIRKTGKEAYLAMPPVFRKSTAQRFAAQANAILNAGFTGCLVRDYEALQFLETIGFAGAIVPDAGLYTFNRRAEAFFLSHGAPFVTAPHELNRKELRRRGMADSVLVAYGYVPLMVSAGCLQAAVKGCGKKSGRLFLQDRYGAHFLVENDCCDCISILYNSVPLSLLKEIKGVLDLKPYGIRLDFTSQDGNEAGKVIAAFAEALRHGACGPGATDGRETTRGHFCRGVE